MKKVLNVLILTVLVVNLSGQSQSELKKASSILWLGLDFTETRFEGQYDFGSPDELTGKYIGAWNQLLAQEPDKFNIPKFFKFSRPFSSEILL